MLYEVILLPWLFHIVTPTDRKIVNDKPVEDETTLTESPSNLFNIKYLFSFDIIFSFQC